MAPNLTQPAYVPCDIDAAYDEWGANCGPAALAAITRQPVNAVCPHVQPWKGYLSFAGMLKALTSMKIAHAVMRKDFKLVAGLLRPDQFFGRLSLIQWHGSWMNEGVHPGAALSRTHWVAILSSGLVFDVNAYGWETAEEWNATAAAIMKATPRCDGRWSVRGSILIRSAAPGGAEGEVGR